MTSSAMKSEIFSQSRLRRSILMQASFQYGKQWWCRRLARSDTAPKNVEDDRQAGDGDHGHQGRRAIHQDFEHTASKEDHDREHRENQKAQPCASFPIDLDAADDD